MPSCLASEAGVGVVTGARGGSSSAEAPRPVERPQEGSGNGSMYPTSEGWNRARDFPRYPGALKGDEQGKRRLGPAEAPRGQEGWLVLLSFPPAITPRDGHSPLGRVQKDAGSRGRTGSRRPFPHPHARTYLGGPRLARRHRRGGRTRSAVPRRRAGAGFRSSWVSPLKRGVPDGSRPDDAATGSMA